MKLSLALVSAAGCLIHSALGISQTNNDQHMLRKPAADQFVGNSMWLFGSDGVYAFSPDGSKQLSHVSNDLVCEPLATFTGSSWRYCRFNDIVSDGKKYVWAAKRDGQIAVFDIDTGSLIGNFKSCEDPENLEYHALRDEVWVRCTGHDANSTDPTHLDVFTASNPSGEIQTDIMLKDRALEEGLTSEGYSVIHHSLGDVGYLTDDSNPKLFKIDLTSKEIMDTIDLYPAVHGLYDATYSPMNGHIYIRALMCCTCGSPESDMESCGRSPGYPVSPTTGKGAGLKDVEGLCGRSCAGMEGVDNVGIYEFDTRTGQVVATHLLAEGFGGDPYPSPDGKYIVLMGKNGGSTVRVLEVGAPGIPSTVHIDLKLDFNREDRYKTLSVARDFAFVERAGRTFLVMPSGTDHKVGIVDFSDNFKISHVSFTDKEFVNTAPHGRYRGVEWAVGTDYVWTNDSTEDEHYIIDVVNAKLVNTIQGVDRSEMISVQNWARVREIEEKEKMMAEIKTMQEQAIKEQAQATLLTVTNQEKVRETAQRESILAEVRASMNDMSEGSVQVEVMAAKAEAPAGGSSATATAALIVGLAALAVGVANLYALYGKGQAASGGSTGTAKLMTGVPPTAVFTDQKDSASVQSSVQNVL